MEKYGIREQVSNSPDRIYSVGDGSFKSALEEYKRIARNAWRSTRNYMQVEFTLVQKMSWWRGSEHHYIEIVRM